MEVKSQVRDASPNENIQGQLGTRSPLWKVPLKAPNNYNFQGGKNKQGKDDHSL